MSESPETRGPIAWMAKNSVAANLGMLVIIAAGAIGIFRTTQEVFPAFDLDVINVSVPYPGASPEEVEQGIALAIEEEVRGLDGVKRVTSTAAESQARVRVEILLDADANQVLADVKTAVDAIQSFPEDAEEPTVSIATRRSRVISLVLAADLSLGELHDIAERVRSDLLRSDEITQVELQGIRPLEIAIEVPREKLQAYGLTLDEIAAQVRAASLELPSGAIKAKGGEVLVRLSDRRLTGHEFEDIRVRSTQSGFEVRLGDIATIVDSYEDTDQEAYYNGKRAVRITAYRVGDESPIKIAAFVRDKVDELEGQLPESVSVATWADESQLLEQRIDLLVRNAAMGLVLVLIILALFLKRTLAGWVALGIPISFFGAFMLMEPLGLTINMISLFALIVTLGLVVDDAIVVGENIFHKTQDGMAPLAAAIEGAREMATPVTFSILTTVAAFSPLLFVPGPIGKIFAVIPTIVITVLLFSLFESFFVLPAHLAHRGNADGRLSRAMSRVFSPVDKLQVRVSARLESFIASTYRNAVETAVRHRYVAVAIGVALFTISVGSVKSGIVSFSFLPKLEGDLVIASARLPYGVPLERTLEVRSKVQEAVERAIERMGPETVRGVFTRVGEGPISRGPGGGLQGLGSHLVTLEVNLVSSGDREYSARDFAAVWNDELPKIAGVESLVVDSNVSGPGGKGVSVQLSHPETEILAQASADLTDTLRSFEGLINVENGYAAGKSQLNFHLTREARTLGITGRDVARTLRASFFGAEALREQRGRNELRVRVRLPKSQRQSESDLEQLSIRSPITGGYVPLRYVATFDRGRAPTEIIREEGQRTVTVQADLGPELKSAREVVESLRATGLPTLEERYPGIEWEFVGEQRDQNEALGSLFGNFGLAFFVMFALLAVPFRSYVQPLIILSAIPFGFVGAVLGHVIMGFGLSVISVMGVIALAGVVVNDSLVLIDATNGFRASGMDAQEAVVQGGMRRFRPILLTSLTTFFGLAPMILETSVQARFLIPMALSLGFGVLVATVVVLILVPALYLIIEDIAGLFGQTTATEPQVAASDS